MKKKCGIRSGRNYPQPCVLPETDLTPDLLSNVRGYWSPNTERALRADLKVFRAWCGIRELRVLPTRPETLAGFIASTVRKKSQATVRRYVWSIATLHRLAGLESPVTALETQLALKRMRQHSSGRQRQALGLTWQYCEHLLEATGSRLIDVRDRALLAVAYDALLRRSELVALQVSDLHTEVDGSGTLLVQRSKTDQRGEGTLQYLTPGTVEKVREWLRRTGIREGRLLRPVRTNGTLGNTLDDSQVPRIFRKMARKAGLCEKFVCGISGHSARVGATQDMIALGIELPLVMHAGRWKSPAMVNR